MLTYWSTLQCRGREKCQMIGLEKADCVGASSTPAILGWLKWNINQRLIVDY